METIQHLLIMMVPGIAGLGPMVQTRVRVPAGADLRHTDHVQWDRPDFEEVIKQA